MATTRYQEKVQRRVEHGLGRHKLCNQDYRNGRLVALDVLTQMERQESPNRILTLQTLRDMPGSEFYRAGLHTAIRAWLGRYRMQNVLRAGPYMRSLRAKAGKTL